MAFTVMSSDESSSDSDSEDSVTSVVIPKSNNPIINRFQFASDYDDDYPSMFDDGIVVPEGNSDEDEVIPEKPPVTNHVSAGPKSTLPSSSKSAIVSSTSKASTAPPASRPNVKQLGKPAATPRPRSTSSESRAARREEIIAEIRRRKNSTNVEEAERASRLLSEIEEGKYSSAKEDKERKNPDT